MFKYGIHNIGVVPISYMAGSPGGTIPVDFALGDLTFTALMDKRLSPGPFDRAPIVQGAWDGAGTPDTVTFPRGDLLANQTDLWYANFDPYQGSIVFWITPEWDGNDGIAHRILGPATSIQVYKSAANNLEVFDSGVGILVSVPIAAWIAGTTYSIVIRWDSRNSLDGIDHGCISINDAHTFGQTSRWAAVVPSAVLPVGSYFNATLSADSLIEGLTVYRRVLWNGETGVDVGNGDEINLMYAAGAGVDPCTITGSFDVVSCVPTNQAGEALQTTGEAWSMPHADSIPDVTFMNDGGLPGTPYAVEFNGTTTVVDCGSGATLDDIPSGGEITIDCAFRADSAGELDSGSFWNKSDGADGYFARLDSSATALRVHVGCDTTDALAVIPAPFVGLSTFVDGKFHILTVHYEDTTKWISIAVDGRWASAYLTRTQGAGNYTTDAALSVRLGVADQGNTNAFDGGIAWVEVWDNDHHTAGTDFIAPRAPTAAGPANLIETWWADEGTGATVAARVTSPANDGTIANGSWSSIWEVEGTPVVPQSVEFNGTTTNLDATSGANIDNLPSEANGFTAEGYFRPAGAGESNNGTFWNKVGWYMRFDAAATIRVFIDYDNTDIDETFSWTPDGIKHHWMLTYNENGADRFARVYLDGVLVHTTAASVGNYVVDAASTLYIGNNAAGTATFDGGVGWQALSDLVRASATFVPNGSELARANDGNMHLRYGMTDGAGAAVADTSGNAYNGTLTNYVWNNTPDMAIDEPGARDFEWGLNIGSDAAADGITIIQAVTAEQDYVNRLFLSYGQSGRAWPEVYLYDNSNAAQIGATYPLPRMHDVHTGGASPTLINANGHFTQQLVGWEAYNVTDGSSTTITAVSGDKTTCTGVLAGGGSNDWQNGEVYIIRPPNGDSYCEHPIATENIFVFRTPVGCVSADFKVRNAAGEGVAQIHQFEIYESLLDNGNMETGVGNPWIPDGWLNYNLAAGEAAQDGADYHSGASSVSINAGDTDGLQGANLTVALGDFFLVGGWFKVSSGTARLTRRAADRLENQYDTNIFERTATLALWTHIAGIGRAVQFPQTYYVLCSGASAFKADDIYVFKLDSITLTITPTSEANSAESGGIRIDGRDTSPSNIPAGYVSASSGWFRFNWRPRHDAAELDSFGAANPTLIHVWGDANNNIQVFVNAANQIRLAVTDGGVLNTNDWNCAGLVIADTEYLMEVFFTGSWCRLYQDGVQVAEVVTPITMVTVPTIIYWGHAQSSDGNVDAVYIAP